jgi:hypothetical protein
VRDRVAGEERRVLWRGGVETFYFLGGLLDHGRVTGSEIHGVVYFCLNFHDLYLIIFFSHAKWRKMKRNRRNICPYLL